MTTDIDIAPAYDSACCGGGIWGWGWACGVGVRVRV